MSTSARNIENSRSRSSTSYVSSISERRRGSN
jgi:hypothetical protein